MILKRAKSDELNLLEKIYDDAFESNADFFPENMEETNNDSEGFSFNHYLNRIDKAVLTIWVSDELIGGAVVSFCRDSMNVLERFFISPEKQGLGYGYMAWVMIEYEFLNAQGWELKTPTCLVNNAFFYINKCGFIIVRVEDLEPDGVGMFVFQKKRNL